jgi:hypothetical protein
MVPKLWGCARANVASLPETDLPECPLYTPEENRFPGVVLANNPYTSAGPLSRFDNENNPPVIVDIDDAVPIANLNG